MHRLAVVLLLVTVGCGANEESRARTALEQVERRLRADGISVDGVVYRATTFDSEMRRREGSIDERFDVLIDCSLAGGATPMPMEVEARWNGSRWVVESATTTIGADTLDLLALQETDGEMLLFVMELKACFGEEPQFDLHDE